MFKDLIIKVKKGIDEVFSNSTSHLAYTISHTEKNTLIGDYGYKEIFDYYIDKYNIKYLKIIDEIGSYYMQSSKKEYILYIIPEKKNDAVVEYIEDYIIEKGYEQTANKVFLSELKERKKIICDKLVYKKEIDFKEMENFAEKANIYESKLGKYYHYFTERLIPFK